MKIKSENKSDSIKASLTFEIDKEFNIDLYYYFVNCRSDELFSVNNIFISKLNSILVWLDSQDSCLELPLFFYDEYCGIIKLMKNDSNISIEIIDVEIHGYEIGLLENNINRFKDRRILSSEFIKTFKESDLREYIQMNIEFLRA